jgi:ribonuclease D
MWGQGTVIVSLPPPILVQTPAAWNDCLAALQKQDQLAVDTESNSLYAYQEQVCLIQVSTPEQDYIIDPLALADLVGLADLMADPGVEKIFHAAEYDLLSMKRDFGFCFANLYDTMLAARILGWKKVGLASILKQEFQVQVNKRYQRANWGRRPLSPEQIAYARQDTHYLFDIRNILERELQAVGRVTEARESFAQVAMTPAPEPRRFCPEDFWGLLNGRYQFTPPQQAVLRELFIFREREAQRRNRPPFKILGNRTLIELAEALPHYPDEFQGIHGLTRRVTNRYGRKLIHVIKKGLRADPPEPPSQRVRPPEVVLIRFDALHNWRKERAAQRGVESDIIVSKKALWEIASRDPKTVEDLIAIQYLGDWQRKEYGKEILRVLRQARRNR